MKISIITINYNNAEGLEKTLKSVVEQSYSDYEYIVIDGNSTDGSVGIIKKYADKISYWLSEPDTGVYNAMNKGIKKAQGEYLSFMNSGDYFVNNNVLKSIFDGENYTIPILRGNFISDYGTHQEQRNNLGDKDITIYDLYTQSLCHQAVFLHKTLFTRYGYYNENLKLVADWEHNLKAILAGEQTLHLQTEVAVYDMNGLSSNEELTNKERQLVIETVIPKAIRTDYEKLFELEKKVNFSQHYFISNFVIAHRFPRLCFRVLHKVYSILKL